MFHLLDLKTCCFTANRAAKPSLSSSEIPENVLRSF